MIEFNGAKDDIEDYSRSLKAASGTIEENIDFHPQNLI